LKADRPAARAHASHWPVHLLADNQAMPPTISADSLSAPHRCVFTPSSNTLPAAANPAWHDPQRPTGAGFPKPPSATINNQYPHDLINKKSGNAIRRRLASAIKRGSLPALF